MNFQIYKLIESKWSKIDIEQVKEGDIIKVFDLDSGEYFQNYIKGIESICTKRARENELGVWQIGSMARVLCTNDAEGDFRNITPDKKYTVIEYMPDFLMYIDNGKKVTEERYKIKDDSGEEYSYPTYCFKVL